MLLHILDCGLEGFIGIKNGQSGTVAVEPEEEVRVLDLVDERVIGKGAG